MSTLVLMVLLSPLASDKYSLSLALPDACSVFCILALVSALENDIAALNAY